jgi:hypothetical protein
MTTSPVSVSLPGPVAEVATSNSTEYALLTNGRVYAWGLGNAGQLGDGATTNSFTKPVRVRFPARVRIASLPIDVMPFDTGLAVDTKGHVWGWGDNQGGELCLGNHNQHLTPVRLPFSHVTAVAGAFDHALYDARGQVWACGLNSLGELGDGTTKPSSVPVKVKGLGRRAHVVFLVAAFANSGALLADGKYLDWAPTAGGSSAPARRGSDPTCRSRCLCRPGCSRSPRAGQYPATGRRWCSSPTATCTPGALTGRGSSATRRPRRSPHPN